MSLCQLCAHYSEGHMFPQACELGEFRSECVERGKFVPRDYPSFREALEREVIRFGKGDERHTPEAARKLRHEIQQLRALVLHLERQVDDITKIVRSKEGGKSEVRHRGNTVRRKGGLDL